MTEALQIFIAYSRKDTAFLDELRTHLNPLERTNKVKIWYDGKIEPGVVWEVAIKENLHSADIILMMVSADAIASDYFYEKEMKDALERHSNGRARVIPLILRPCAWQATQLGELQALPRDGKPVSTWPDRDDAYANAISSLILTLDSIRTEREAATKQAERERLQREQDSKTQAAAKAAAAQEAARQKKEQDARIENQRLQKEQAQRNAEADARRRQQEETDRLKKAEEDQQRKAETDKRREQQLEAIGTKLRSPVLWGIVVVFVMVFLIGNWLCNRNSNKPLDSAEYFPDTVKLDSTPAAKIDTPTYIAPDETKTNQVPKVKETDNKSGEGNKVSSNTETIKDKDNDGVPDSIDKCPNEKGTVNNGGCPIEDNNIFSAVDESAHWTACISGSVFVDKGCYDRELLKFIYANLKYPTVARENGVEGTVYVRFVVEKDGSITAPEIVRDIGAGCGDEALRIVKRMPKWTPAMKNGTPVRAWFNLPIKFKLE